VAVELPDCDGVAVRLPVFDAVSVPVAEGVAVDVRVRVCVVDDVALVEGEPEPLRVCETLGVAEGLEDRVALGVPLILALPDTLGEALLDGVVEGDGVTVPDKELVELCEPEFDRVEVTVPVRVRDGVRDIERVIDWLREPVRLRVPVAEGVDDAVPVALPEPVPLAEAELEQLGETLCDAVPLPEPVEEIDAVPDPEGGGLMHWASAWWWGCAPVTWWAAQRASASGLQWKRRSANQSARQRQPRCLLPSHCSNPRRLARS
jgi:hypothetical protein